MNQQLITTQQSLNSLTPSATPRPDETWLYALMLLVPESIYGWLLYSTPALRTLPNLLVITALFGLHGEGLANIARHAQARQVWVTLQQEAQGITLLVRDDGRGFDPAATRGNGHYGLIGLAERAHLAGGALDIASTPGVGTTLTLQLPLPTPTATIDQLVLREQAHA